jgi:hypothetical protein
MCARGTVSDEERDCAAAMISAVLTRHRRAVGGARVRVSGAHCAGGPGLVQVNLRVCGAPARIQVAARTMPQAIAAAAARLDRQIRRLTTVWEPWPWPDPERRSLGVPGDGAISRLKSYRLLVGMPCQAAAFLSAMDYDVLLYSDAETGEDAIVYRAGPTGLALARQKTMRPPALPSPLPLTVNPRKTPTLTPGQAATKLAEGWLPYLFYTDDETRRGNLLYRRHDGDLGLIAPKTGIDPTRTLPMLTGPVAW